jgi:hypothetical protein
MRRRGAAAAESEPDADASAARCGRLVGSDRLGRHDPDRVRLEEADVLGCCAPLDAALVTVRLSVCATS